MNTPTLPAQTPTVQNRLLRALPGEVLSLMLPLLEEVPLAAGERVVTAGEPIPHAWFFESGLASVMLHTAERGSYETLVVGRDGMVSTALVLGVEHMPVDVEVRVPGTALRIGAGALRQMMVQSGVLREVLMRYVQVAMLWMSQMALSNRRHRIEERLAHWLLLATDRIDGSEIVMTHEALAQVLGTHRPGITVALHELERAQMIATRRGQITVIDRARLSRAAGESYGLAEAEYKRLIGPFA